MKQKNNISFVACLLLLALTFVIGFEVVSISLLKPKTEVASTKHSANEDIYAAFEEDDCDDLAPKIIAHPCFIQGISFSGISAQLDLLHVYLKRFTVFKKTALFLSFRVLRI